MAEIDLASILILERERRGLSLRAAARELGISNPYLSQLETGRMTNPSLDVIQRLTKFYHIKPELWMRVRVTPNEAPLSALRLAQEKEGRYGEHTCTCPYESAVTSLVINPLCPVHGTK